MNAEFESIPLIKNDSAKRFEMEVDGHLAFINFGEYEGQLALVHTESPVALAGRGAGSAIVEKTLQWAKENDYTILPYCPFVFTYIKRHPEWKDFVDPEFPGYAAL